MRVPAKFVCEGCGHDTDQTGAHGWCVVGVASITNEGDACGYIEKAHLCKECAEPFNRGLWFIDPEREVKR